MTQNVDTNDKKPVIKNFWFEKGYGVFGHWSKIGEHKRKTGKKIYSSSRIVLPSEFNRYIGRSYVPFHAKLEMKLSGQEKEPKIYDCIILVLD